MILVAVEKSNELTERTWKMVVKWESLCPSIALKHVSTNNREKKAKFLTLKKKSTNFIQISKYLTFLGKRSFKKIIWGIVCGVYMDTLLRVKSVSAFFELLSIHTHIIITYLVFIFIFVLGFSLFFLGRD